MKKIRSKYVKDSLLDYASLKKSLKENTVGAVETLLAEQVKDTYNKILSESDDDYEEEEMEDTDSENQDTEEGAVEDDSANEETSTEVTPDGAVEKTTTGSDGKGNEWSEFEKYKVSDDQYDFSNAEDEEIVKAYKLMKDEDQLVVTKDGDMVHLTDNETGADYIINLQSVPSEDETMSDGEDEFVDDTTNEESGDTDFELEVGDESDDSFDDFEDDSDADGDFTDDLDSFDDFTDEENSTEEDEDGSEGDAEYEVYSDSDEDVDSDDTEDEGDDYEDNENDNNERKNMNEQRIFEIALNEYDSNVGYTDNYQKKDVMTNPGMSEPAKSKSVNDWDKGVPHGTEKPWSGKKGGKSENQPFHGEKGTTIEEEFDECGDMFEEDDMGEYGNVSETPMEEATNVGGFVQQNTTSKSHVPTSNGRSARSASKGGKRVKGTVTPRYSGGEEDTVSENIRRKANQIFKENQQLKKILNDFRSTLNEAAVTNVNLGKIIKLISENSTTAEEKKEIIARFGREAKSVGAANALYESISEELKKKGKMNINEDKQFTANSSKLINETQIYKSNDLMESLGLMHKICKL